MVILPVTYPKPVQPEGPGQADQVTDVRDEGRELAVQALLRQQGQQ